MNPIYLDNNASTHIYSEVIAKMLPLLKNDYGNPSSSHHLGRKSKQIIETARKYVSELLRCNSENIIFTSGGTESNNLAIQGFSKGLLEKKNFITSAVEHPSVLKVFKSLEEKGHTVTYLPVDCNGLISAKQVEEAIKNNPDTVLISIMYVNNETGVIFPIREIGSLAKKYNIHFHCDAVQAAGKIPINVDELNVDSLSISGHKIHGPKGIGALYIRKMNNIHPLFQGGGQENGKRSGTEAVPSIAGFGEACRLILNYLQEFSNRTSELRNKFEDGIKKIMPNAVINAENSPRVCNTANIRFPGIIGREFLSELSNNGIYASHGSACSDNHAGNSHVLKAMGLNDAEICSSIRFSLSNETTSDDINQTITRVSKILNYIKPQNDISSENLSSQLNTELNYGMHEEELQELWTLTKGSSEICIAILDGPVDLSYKCFIDAQIDSINITGSESDYSGLASEHGTNVTSIIFSNNEGCNKGIAPKCKGLIIPIYDNDKKTGITKCNQLDLARAIIKAVELGANVINISGGQLVSSRDGEHYLNRAIELCKQKNVLIAAAAGNNSCRCIHVPAAFPSVLAVGALNSNGLPAEYSNWGDEYNDHGILALGENVPVSSCNGNVTSKSGTSFAAAIVSGIAALLLSYQIDIGQTPDPMHIKNVILNSALQCTNSSEHCLTGKLNISGALKQIKQNANNKKYDTSDFKMKGSLVKMINEQNNSRNENTTLTVNSGDSVITPSACGCSSNSTDQNNTIYALGSIGYDFGSEARRDSFIQMLSSESNPSPDPYNAEQLLDHLDQYPDHSTSIIWLLNQENTPIYAIQPAGAYSNLGYETIREFLRDGITNNSDICAIPGTIAGKVTLLNGYVVPVIIPELRGMYNWSIPKLLAATKKSQRESSSSRSEFVSKSSNAIANFLRRLYYELSNLGSSPSERALNYTGTNIVQVTKVIEEAILNDLVLDMITPERSKLCRPNSDCWDIKLTFFNPAKLTEQARRVFLFTIDVSDIVPVTIGNIRSWDVF